MFGNEKLSEKKYSKHGYEYVNCPRCDGFGSDLMSPFSKVPCHQCEGTGTLMVENSREMEVASHLQRDNSNEQKNKWLFGD